MKKDIYLYTDIKNIHKDKKRKFYNNIYFYNKLLNYLIKKYEV